MTGSRVLNRGTNTGIGRAFGRRAFLKSTTIALAGMCGGLGSTVGNRPSAIAAETLKTLRMGYPEVRHARSSEDDGRAGEAARAARHRRHLDGVPGRTKADGGDKPRQHRLRYHRRCAADRRAGCRYTIRLRRA